MSEEYILDKILFDAGYTTIAPIYKEKQIVEKKETQKRKHLDLKISEIKEDDYEAEQDDSFLEPIPENKEKKKTKKQIRGEIKVTRELKKEEKQQKNRKLDDTVIYDIQPKKTKLYSEYLETNDNSDNRIIPLPEDIENCYNICDNLYQEVKQYKNNIGRFLEIIELFYHKDTLGKQDDKFHYKICKEKGENGVQTQFYEFWDFKLDKLIENGTLRQFQINTFRYFKITYLDLLQNCNWQNQHYLKDRAKKFLLFFHVKLDKFVKDTNTQKFDTKDLHSRLENARIQTHKERNGNETIVDSKNIEIHKNNDLETGELKEKSDAFISAALNTRDVTEMTFSMITRFFNWLYGTNYPLDVHGNKKSPIIEKIKIEIKKRAEIEGKKLRIRRNTKVTKFKKRVWCVTVNISELWDFIRKNQLKNE